MQIPVYVACSPSLQGVGQLAISRMTVEQGAHMEVASLLERQPDCSSGDALGAPPFSTKRVASLGDMVSGTTSRFPDELPGGVLR